MAVHLLQVTVGAGTRTQVTSTPTLAKQAVFQNNAGNAMRIGDSSTTSSKGISLTASGGSFNTGPATVQHVDLSRWYVAGTAADILDILYID